MNLQNPTLFRTFEVQNHTNGATRSPNPCSGFLLDLLKGTPFALCIHCNGVCSLSTRSCDFAAGSRGVYYFKKMQNHTKKELSAQVAKLTKENTHLKVLHKHSTNINFYLEQKQRQMNAVFWLTPEQRNSLPIVADLLQKLHQCPLVSEKPTDL
tara:strand:- start:5540 stop:6001 length:462 start_codon:yes stop_codon:yes gene_type:complete